MTPREAAEQYLAAGLHPIPVRPDKTPFIRWKAFQDRAPTSEEIAQWFGQWPGAQVAVLTGIVIDVLDVEAHAISVLESLDMPLTPACVTQRGGLHVYFATGALRTTTWARGGVHLGDLRARGAYVVAPPSEGEHGAYAWLPGRALGEIPLAKPPQWLRQWPEEHTGTEGTRRTGTPGGRSETDLSLAVSMVLQGATDPKIADALAGRGTVHDRGRYGDEYIARTIAKVQRAVWDAPTVALRDASW